jgi:glycerol-3-phosphate acyltransferase PlsY
MPSAAPTNDPLAPLRRRSWLTEAQRKAIHLSFILLPLELLHQWLPWPRGKGEWRLVLVAAVCGAILIDLLRIHEQRARRLFREFFGQLMRPHERWGLLGSTYLLLAALLAIEIFRREVAAAAIGFTVVGDAFAALGGRAYGRTRIFGKSIEGFAIGLAACLVWAVYLAWVGHLPWHVVVAGAVAASLVELLPIPLDDNLGMTLAAGYAMTLLAGSA